MEFENIFDEALYGADGCILDIMGITVLIEVHGVMKPFVAVFDDPADDLSLPNQAGNFQDVNPTLFTRTAPVMNLPHKTRVEIPPGPGRADTLHFWVVKVGPDDGGTCVITLARGQPGDYAPSADKWSGNHECTGLEGAAGSAVRYRPGRHGGYRS